jgi:hypothetical protein
MTSKTETAANAAVDFADLDATGEVPFEFEYLIDGTKPSGIFLFTLSGQCPTVAEAVNKEVNARRKNEAMATARNAHARPGSAEFIPIEDDVAFGKRLSAVRLCGWRGPGDTAGLDEEQLKRFRGINQPWSKENALKLCQINAEISSQVLEKSNITENFIKLSPRS